MSFNKLTSFCFDSVFIRNERIGAFEGEEHGRVRGSDGPFSIKTRDD